MLGVCRFASAQCVPVVTDVLIDELRGSIIVETQYTLNGVVVDVDTSPCTLNTDNGKYEIEACNKQGCFMKECIGRGRYNYNDKTFSEIATLAKNEIREHRDKLIIVNAVKLNNLHEVQLNIIKASNEPLKDLIKTNAVGWTEPATEVIFQLKNKEITVNADSTYTIVDIP